MRHELLLQALPTVLVGGAALVLALVDVKPVQNGLYDADATLALPERDTLSLTAPLLITLALVAVVSAGDVIKARLGRHSDDDTPWEDGFSSAMLLLFGIASTSALAMLLKVLTGRYRPTVLHACDIGFHPDDGDYFHASSVDEMCVGEDEISSDELNYDLRMDFPSTGAALGAFCAVVACVCVYRAHIVVHEAFARITSFPMVVVIVGTVLLAYANAVARFHTHQNTAWSVFAGLVLGTVLGAATVYRAQGSGLLWENKSTARPAITRSDFLVVYDMEWPTRVKFLQGVSLLLVIVLALTFEFTDTFRPAQSGAFEADPQIAKVHRDGEVIPVSALAVATLVLPCMIMMVCEALMSMYTASKVQHAFFAAAYYIWLFCVHLLIVNGVKNLSGRWRPDTLERCEISRDSNSDTYLSGPQVQDACRDADVSWKDIYEQRRSFPSGHSSSFAFACTILGLYCGHVFQRRLARHQSWGSLIQVVLVAVAAFGATGRLRDNRHDGLDVIVGVVAGVAVAAWGFFYDAQPAGVWRVAKSEDARLSVVDERINATSGSSSQQTIELRSLQ